MGIEAEVAALKDIVRIGTVSSVDVSSRTARVVFPDKENMVSGPLKVVQNQPLITVEKTIAGKKWDYAAQYASADRKLGLGESYTTAAPDVITNTTPDNEIKYAGEIRGHTQEIKVYPWLPYIGQAVLCLYLPNGESDGFVIGGI